VAGDVRLNVNATCQDNAPRINGAPQNVGLDVTRAAIYKVTEGRFNACGVRIVRHVRRMGSGYEATQEHTEGTVNSFRTGDLPSALPHSLLSHTI
jgi:hypothetical protein